MPFESNLSKNWDHLAEEQPLYTAWEAAGCFRPQGDGQPFSMLLPPPNANEALHTGHAMFTVQDILARRARMQGRRTLWQPGTDHAGFETQVVFEKKLEKEGKSRFDFDRPAFYDTVLAYTKDNQATILSQLRSIGFSLDWQSLYFTLDPGVVSTTKQTFKKMYDDGLVYRDNRLVNYCTKHGTGFSDLEVEYKEVEGTLWYIDYPLVSNPSEHITVATTRPETMLGDVAVAVHPEDQRYQHLIGQAVKLPLTDRQIPVLADDMVDQTFGTGAVKITPAHDPNDFAVSKHHDLPLIQVIGFNGKLTDQAPEKYRGLRVKAARQEIITDLTAAGLLSKTTAHTSSVGHCYKCGTIIEPLPIPQWYVKVRDTDPKISLADLAQNAVESGQIKIMPERFHSLLLQWYQNLHDWNISRQIWWGIDIPAWQCQACRDWTVTSGQPPDACQHCQKTDLKQDPDVFDTWFSSSQLPYAALQQTSPAYFKQFYPNTVMETGHDILTWWVSRMIMLGLYVTGQVPFQHVYLHGMVTDRQGKKMSKSKGNVINPRELTAKYGADALRMALIMGNSPGQPIALYEDKVRGMRNFSNKVWNAGRFSLANLAEYHGPSFNETPEPSTDIEQAILSALATHQTELNQALDNWKIGTAAEMAHDFFWHTVCDKFLEEAKPLLNESPETTTIRQTLGYVFTVSLKLIHPFMPFVTERLWQELRRVDPTLEPFCMLAPWPKSE